MKKIKGEVAKSATGIRGLDEITAGGFPKNRVSLVCGNAGCGKTILGMEYLAHGALEFKEPGVFISFEETAPELESNFASMGYNLKELEAQKLLLVDYVYIERSEIEETGQYDLDGLFIRIEHAIKTIGAKRVVLDTLEVLFSGLTQESIIRAELRRLFRWLKEKGITAVITGERGEGALTRYGLEEYVADCVILLDLRVVDQIATRRLRIIKYRGSRHGTDEYPFLIDEQGISILPLTSLALDHKVSSQFISTGIPRLDTMLQGKGYYEGSTILVSGTAGSGKSSLVASFVQAAAKRSEKCLYFAFEESPDQIKRNMRSIGLDLEPLEKKKLLTFHASRPSTYGLEMHLVMIHKIIAEVKPKVVVMDPISNLIAVGSVLEAKSMLTRLIDYLKTNNITAFFTDLVHAGTNLETSNEEISSLIDTWISLRDFDSAGERNRGLHIIKSRGMAHSNQIREFLITDKGIQLLDVYVGNEGVLTGSARVAQESRRRNELRELKRLRESRQLERRNQQHDIKAQIKKLENDLAQIDNALQESEADEQSLTDEALADSQKMKLHRRGD